MESTFNNDFENKAFVNRNNHKLPSDNSRMRIKLLNGKTVDGIWLNAKLKDNQKVSKGTPLGHLVSGDKKYQALKGRRADFEYFIAI